MMKEETGEGRVKRTQRDYPLEFKLGVVRELETTPISMNAISRKYGIQGESTVSRWLSRYGTRDPSSFAEDRPRSAMERRTAKLERELAELKEKLGRRNRREAFYDTLSELVEKGFRVVIYKDGGSLGLKPER